MFFFFAYMLVGCSLLGAIQGSLFLWAFLEVSSLFFMVVIMNLGSKQMMLEGLVNYFLVQVLGGVLILSSILCEMGLYGNFFVFNHSVGFFSYFSVFLSLLLKMSVFPFYFQIVFIFMKMKSNQCFFVSTFSKVWPLLLFLQMFMGFSYLTLLMAMLTVLVGGFYSLWSGSFHEILAWSTISHTGWMMLVMFSGTLLFLAYFTMYSAAVWIIWGKVYDQNKMFFFSGNFLYFNKSDLYVVLLLLVLLSGFAPSLGFGLKLMVILGLLKEFFFIFMVVLMLLTVSAVFFYFRMVQFLSSVNGNYKGFDNLVKVGSFKGVFEILVMSVLVLGVTFLWI